MIIVFIMVLMMLVISIIVPAQALAYTEKPPPQPHAPGFGGAGGGGGGVARSRGCSVRCGGEAAGGEAAGGEAAGGSGRPSSTRTARRPCRPRRRPRRRPQSDPRGLPSGSKGSGGRGRPGQLCVRGVGMTIIPPAPEGGRVVDRAPAPRRFTVATRIARWDVPSSVRCVWRAWRGRDAACKRSRGADPRADLGRRGQRPPPPYLMPCACAMRTIAAHALRIARGFVVAQADPPHTPSAHSKGGAESSCQDDSMWLNAIESSCRDDSSCQEWRSESDRRKGAGPLTALAHHRKTR